MHKKFILIAIALIFVSSATFSQSSKNIRISGYYDKPTIEVSYGLSEIRLNGNNFNLSDAGLLEMKLGFSTQRQSGYGRNILNYNNRYLFLSYTSSENISRSNNSGIENNLWRFGLGNKQGYGVKMGSFSILPYTSNSFGWSRFDYTDKSGTNTTPELNDFSEAFRFGSSSEAGINFQISRGFSLQPKYEIADIYPRHLFAKQMLSSVIETGGLLLIDGFSKSILRNTPVAGTFVSFILKNAYQYGFYQLRKNQMNWPFTSTAPLRYNTFKLGMTFTF